jgi:pectin methylesterase-like acyl-CoA thioesterase
VDPHLEETGLHYKSDDTYVFFPSPAHTDNDMVYSYFFLALLTCLSNCAFATSKNSPPAGSLTVGPSGTYKTISAAVAAASKGATIFIYAGTYNEAVYITVDNLKIYGQTAEYVV